MAQYIKVAEDENMIDSVLEVPCEDDNTLLLTTLSSLFPGASGLKYRNAESGSMRGLRLIDGKLHAPDENWSSVPMYYCCFPKENKRKIEDQSEATNTKTKRVDDKKKCSDLIVLGLPWKTTDKELREYFEQFGELLMAQVKKDPKSGNSKGFGFVRFSDYENQLKAVSKRHEIQGRWCDVRIPVSKDSYPNDRNQEFNRKIFIGRITAQITVDDLRDYFSKYGEINDIFIPKPFRGFAFVTYTELTQTDTLYGDDHIIKGISVHVSNAVPKVEMNSQPSPYNNNGNNKHYGNRYASSGYSSYSSNSHNNHLTTGMAGIHGSPGHPTNYSPSYSSPSQYDYYGRQRSNQQPHSYHDSGNPYHHRSYGSQFNSNDYSPYY